MKTPLDLRTGINACITAYKNQKNNAPPHPKGCDLIQALVFRMLQN